MFQASTIDDHRKRSDPKCNPNKIDTLYLWVHPDYSVEFFPPQERYAVLIKHLQDNPNIALVEIPYFHPRTREEVEQSRTHKIADWEWEKLSQQFVLSDYLSRVLAGRYIFWGESNLNVISTSRLYAEHDELGNSIRNEFDQFLIKLGERESSQETKPRKRDLCVLKDRFDIEPFDTVSHQGLLFNKVVCFGKEESNCVYGQYKFTGLDKIALETRMYGELPPM